MYNFFSLMVVSFCIKEPLDFTRVHQIELKFSKFPGGGPPNLPYLRHPPPPPRGRTFRPVISHSMSGTLMPIFEGFSLLFNYFYVFLLKHLMNLLTRGKQNNAIKFFKTATLLSYLCLSNKGRSLPSTCKSFLNPRSSE